jgi:hypothetical protein
MNKAFVGSGCKQAGWRWFTANFITYLRTILLSDIAAHSVGSGFTASSDHRTVDFEISSMVLSLLLG